MEGSRIAIGEQSKWSYNHFSNTPTPQSLAPPLLALNATRSLPSNDGLPSPASVSNRNSITLWVNDPPSSFPHANLRNSAPSCPASPPASNPMRSDVTQLHDNDPLSLPVSSFASYRDMAKLGHPRLPASNSMHLDVSQCHPGPITPISGPETMLSRPHGSPISRRIDVIPRQTFPPDSSALTSTCFGAPRLDSKPNLAISTPVRVSHQPDDDLPSPSFTNLRDSTSQGPSPLPELQSTRNTASRRVSDPFLSPSISLRPELMRIASPGTNYAPPAPVLTQDVATQRVNDPSLPHEPPPQLPISQYFTVPHAFQSTPLDSCGFQWTSPSQSTGIHLSPQDSLSVHRNPPQSTGIHLSPQESTSVHRIPSQSTGIHLSPQDSLSVHRIPPQSTGFPLSPQESTSVHWIPCQSTGFHLSPVDSTSVHWSPSESTGFQLSPPDSFKNGKLLSSNKDTCICKGS